MNTIIPSFFTQSLENPIEIESDSPMQTALKKFLTQPLNSATLQSLETLCNPLPPAHLLDAQALYDEYMLNQKVIDKLMLIANSTPEMAERIILNLLQRNKNLAENSEFRFSKSALTAESARISKITLCSNENSSNIASALFQRIYDNGKAKKLALQAFLKYEKTVKADLSKLNRTQPTHGNGAKGPKP